MRKIPWRIYVSLLASSAAWPLGAQNGAAAPVQPAPKGWRFVFKNHPSLRNGDWFRMDFRLRFQYDFRTFDPEVPTDEGDVPNLRKFRVGVEGYVTKDFEYKVDREIRNEFADWFDWNTRITDQRWRDVYGNWRHYRRLQIRAGQFKIPFGMDQLQYETKGEMIHRSLIGVLLAPGRGYGAMLHGKPLNKRLEYQAGFFRSDGWRARTKDNEWTGQRTFAARMVVPPFAFYRPRLAIPKPLEKLYLGAAFTESPVPEGLHSLRGRSWVLTHNWFERVFVRGHRLRLGAELNWEPGPLVFKGEAMRVRDQRLKQGILENDLPNLIARGWYFTTGWVITGEPTFGGIKPKRDFVTGGGIGAIQIAARYEQILFASSKHDEIPSRSSRAANFVSASERIATFGVNWYWNRFGRIQFNALREVIEDATRAPIPGVDTFWSYIVRIQFVL